MKAIVLAAAMQVVMVSSALAQSQTQTDPPPEIEGGEIVVTPPASAEALVREFVAELTAPSPQDQMPVWDRTICPGVTGMRGVYARAMIDQIARRAYEIGLDVGEPGCRANVLIYFTENANALATEIVNQRRLVSARGEQGHSRGRDALRDFATTPRAVRWWHVSRTYTADGFEVDQGGVVSIRSVGRLRSNTRQDLDRVLIVIDATLIEGVRFGAIADYVAMAALAQINPEADVSALPSILSLFADTAVPKPDALTEWDVAYLQGLYGTSRDARSERQQEREIARRMTDRAP